MSFMNNVRLSGMSKKQSISKRGQWQIMLHDDKHNTFEHVIDCMIEICGHNYYQAVQCAILTHNNKQCSIFVDTWDICNDTCDALVEQGLTAQVIKYKKQ